MLQKIPYSDEIGNLPKKKKKLISKISKIITKNTYP